MPDKPNRWKRATLLFSAISAVASGLLLTLGIASGYLPFIIPYPEPRPRESSLVLEFSRLPSASNTALIMKLAEGAVFELAPQWSFEDKKQYWVTDGSNRFGLASEALREIWKSHALNGKSPVSTNLWETVSGNDDAIKALSLLSLMAALPESYSSNPMAAEYGCFESKMLDEFDCFCPNQTLERSAKKLFDTNDLGPICSSAPLATFSFLFTIASIENEGDRPIKNLKLTFTDTSASRNPWISSPLGIVQNCRLEDFIDTDNFPTGSLHACGQDYLNRLNFEKHDYGERKELEMSSLEPGQEIFLLPNAYLPDSRGLPRRYIAGHFNIHRLDYTEGGQYFSIISPAPLATRRLPIITSPDGGRGGQ